MGKVFSFQNNKGGVSKTTSTTSIAGILANEYNKKVLIIDADAQGNSSLVFGLNPNDFQNTLYDVVVDGLEPEKTIVQVNDNLAILPSNSDSEYFDMDIFMEINKFPNPFLLLKNSLQPLKEQYDYIMIDTSPSMGLMNMNVLCFSDEVIIPFQPDITAVKGIVIMYEKIQEIKEKFNPSLEVGGVLPVMVNRRTNIHRDVMEQVNKFCKDNNINYFENLLTHTIVYSDSVAYDGMPAVWSQKNHESVKQYYRLVEEMIEKDVL